MRWIALPLICVAVAAVAATAATARTDARAILTVTTAPTARLATGIDDSVFQGPQETTAYAMTKQNGAQYARLIVRWDAIAPKTLPAKGFYPADPTSPYYHWIALDRSLAAAQAAGVTPIIDLVAPPHWAYAVKPAGWAGGSPQIAALHAFATAIAKHYDGSGPAPPAHIFSVWDEPNYKKNLYPQSPTYYRFMVNAVANAVHAVDPSDLVLAGELAPVKHASSAKDRNHAIPPLAFMRSMFCISSTTPVHRTCTAKAQFDVWAHHPYSDTGPFGHSKNSDGVELGDLPKMRKLLQTAVRLGAISSAHPVQFWVTEVGWASNPPNALGAPMLLEARWLAESMYQTWKSGATVGIWFRLRDKPSGPFQSGLYFRAPTLAGSRPKPLLNPFRFPFVAYLKPQGKVFIWGRDTTSDVRGVSIQEQIHNPGPWKTVAVVTANKNGIFQATLPLGANRTYWLRATAPGSGISRPFALEVPQNENLIVVPFPAG